MTRIVAGAFRGRRLVLPDDPRVRPTADRVREAWLSIVGPWLPGAKVLDLFSGSGALGIEALSRWADQATFVELSPTSAAAIGANLAALGLESRATLLKREAVRFLSQVTGKPFDIAFADPPYQHEAAREVAERFMAAPFARVLGIEHAAKASLPDGDTRRYGDVSVTFYYDL